MNSNPGNPKDTHLSELVHGACLSYTNAEALFREAKILSAHKAFSRALFLHQISLEECGKTEIIGWWTTAHLMGNAVDLGNMRSQLASHKDKNFANAYMLPLSESEQKARDESDWKREHQAFKEQQIDFHQESNDRKNASLYVDFIDGVFFAPNDHITEDMVHEIAERNYEFIELMRPKVEMFTRWNQNPATARDSMMGFQELMERLRTEHPDHPQEAFDALFGEMAAQQKNVQQPPVGDIPKAAPQE
ncbi:MAG TPA: AbiV family abortive infection protein [Elusimicrobiota bacterium]|nr:AbiV family abortive infection protein [Elusimicrobiota bacterium]